MESNITITAGVSSIVALIHGMDGKVCGEEPADRITLHWFDPRRGQYAESTCNIIVPAGIFKTTDRIKIEVSKC